MRADRRLPATDGARPGSLEEVAVDLAGLAAALSEFEGVEDGIDGALWDAALLDPLRDILSHPGKGFRARLMQRCWVIAGGGRDDFPDLLAHSIELLHAGSLVIDDIEDDSRSRRGRPTLHRRYGLPLALNTGNLLYFLALELVGRAPIPARRRLDLFGDVSLAVLRSHQGQALDLSVRITDIGRSRVPALVDTVTRLKTGSLMRLASVLGARSAGAGREVLDAFGRFGTELGVGLQMLDDWSGIHLDSRREKGIEDIRLARPTWPWAWLAESNDELAYAETARQAREISIEWQGGRVRERLHALLAATAPDAIQTQLDGAVERLRLELGESVELMGLARDIGALARAFEEG